MRVTVLGASGFVGTAVAQELARREIRLRLVGRREFAPPADAVADIEIHRADLSEPGEMADAIKDADAIVHLVAYIAGETTWRVADGDTAAERVNLGLVHELIEVAKASGRRPEVLFAGSASQVGPSTKELLDGSEPDNPSNAYDRQKLAAETALKDATNAGLLNAATLRMPPVFGHHAATNTASKGVVTAMIQRALDGQPLTIWNDGSVRRDIIHVDDAARAFAAALDHAPALAGRHWLLGTGRGPSLQELFSTIAEAVADHTGQPPVPVVTVPAPDYADATDTRSMDIDSSAFQAATGWKPAASIREAVIRTARAVADQRKSATCSVTH